MAKLNKKFVSFRDKKESELTDKEKKALMDYAASKNMKFKFVKALSLVLIAASILSVTGCSNGYKNSILSSVALYVDEDCTLVDKTKGRESLTYFYKLDVLRYTLR